MSKIVQLRGRSGFYIRISVPAELRQAMRTNTLQWKAGATKAEAVRNRPALLAKADLKFTEKRRDDPAREAFRDVCEDPFIDLPTALEARLRALGLTPEQIQTVLYDKEELRGQGIEPAPVDPKYKAAIDSRLAGGTPYTEWITKRLIEEKPTRSTEKGWKTTMNALATWYGSPYVGEMTKVEAGEYKQNLMVKLKDTSVRTKLTCIKAFWNWAIDNGYAEENIWTGLTRKLDLTTDKKPLQTELLNKARIKAEELGDIGFFLQLYTGCRRGEHCGLRYSDIDLDNNWIHFKQYTHGEITRDFKGKRKDVRSVPINSALRIKLIDLLPEAASNNKAIPIWPELYKKSSQLFGDRWSDRFTNNYHFQSHDLRSHVVTALSSSNVSPFILWEITRHSVPGMSAVVSGYVRPTEEQLRETMKLLN